MFVVDASVTLAWAFDDEGSSTTAAILDRLVNEGGLTPAHWPLEVTNAIRSAERRGRLEEGAHGDLERMVSGLPIDVVPIDIRGAFKALQLAQAHGLSVYDAAYIELAASRGLGLATADRRLVATCRTVGVLLIQ
jgi:predicted nucleic acid-binding protein